MFYNGHYYVLSQQRIPYMKDKTADERFFILTLFAIALEARDRILTPDTFLQVELPVGLPPKHYGALYEKFEQYFMDRGRQDFTYRGKDFHVDIMQAMSFPQDYAASMTKYGQIKEYSKVLTIDIGGVTLDYLMIRDGAPDLSVCDSLEKGIIPTYNKLLSRITNEYDILLEESDIDSIIRGRKTDYRPEIINMVRAEMKTYVDDILGTLREKRTSVLCQYTDLKTGCVVFIGGGAVLLKEYLENSDRIGNCIFIDDLCANAKGYELLYQIQKKGR